MALTEAVGQVDSPQSLLGLLRDELDWPLETSLPPEEITFEWDAGELRLPDGSEDRVQDGIVRQLRPASSAQPWGVFLVQFTDGRVYKSALRQVLRGLVPRRKRDPGLQAWKHDNLLFICTTSECDRFTFAHFRGEKAQRARLATFGWEQGDTYIRTLCEHNLPRLRWPEDGGADVDAWLKSWAGAFDKEPLTRDFFRSFDKALEAVQSDLQQHQGLDSARAYSRAQLLLERLIFLYFLQERGWLDQKRDYLLHGFQDHRGQPEDFAYYERFLEPLFWTLASAPGSPHRLEGIPFLNGGLFDDDEFALTDERRRQSPPLKVRNATFARVFDQLLEAFNFTVTEDTPLDQDVAVDPEMLGKVFESIVLHAEAADPDAVAPDKRKATGSYYTPRIVVHFICREALFQYLANHLPGDGWRERLRDIMDFDARDGLDREELDRLRGHLKPGEAGVFLEVLKGLKCCDPALGSGAFPVGLMHELVNLRRIVEAAASGFVDPARKAGADWVHRTKADIIENCLYGVDIQQQAIEICRLRLWLSLIVDYDLGVDPFEADRKQFREAIRAISQLPNLEMNFHRGDSLHDHVSGVPIYIEPGSEKQHRPALKQIRELGAGLQHARQSKTKKGLRLGLLGHKLALTRAVLDGELDKLERRQRPLWDVGKDTSKAEKRRQHDEEMAQVQAALAKLAADQAAVEALRADLQAPDFYPRLRRLEGADLDSPFNFAWRLDFAAIFGLEDGGFDIVVGNPPFVTARNPVKRELWRKRWPQVCHGKYHLLCPFVALSFAILRPNGELGFIVSNAFATRDFGRPLVEGFLPTVSLQEVVDCSGLMFPGHGTPTCILIGRNCSPEADAAVMVTGTLPGGGDLRTPPEESPLWSALAQHHNEAGYQDDRIAVSEVSRDVVCQHPWSFDVTSTRTKHVIEAVGSAPLRDLLDDDVGVCTMTNCDDVFVLSAHEVRRLLGTTQHIRAFQEGDTQRNWGVAPDQYAVAPYDEQSGVLKEADLRPCVQYYLSQYEVPLASRKSFGSKTFAELGREYYSFERMNATKYAHRTLLVWCFVATHVHSSATMTDRLFKQSNMVASVEESDEHLLPSLAGLLNSSAALFWLKQVCFSKRESEEGAKDTYYEFAGGKVQQLPVPDLIAAALKGKATPLSGKLTALSCECWERGQVLPSLAMKKLFEAKNEAYHDWNSSLPGYVDAHGEIAGLFTEADELRGNYERCIAIRERLRAEMIARQEEMDWLVYEAYGLIGHAETLTDEADLTLQREQRPFCLWALAEGDLAKAERLIPKDWPEAKRALWRERLALIRDNEHVRRIEQPVYKRRWDEQWKVGGSWQCGRPAYDAEFVDAFDWWLSEKAEWWLEHQAKGAVPLEAWTDALRTDFRVEAAWQVAAECIHRLDVWKRERKDNPPGREPRLDPSPTAFAKHFKKLVKDQSVPEGIPWAVPWDELAKRNVKVTAKTKTIRGKLNVPRERFWETKDKKYRQARPLG